MPVAFILAAGVSTIAGPMDGVARQRANEGTGAGADEGPFTLMARLVSGDRAKTRAKESAEDGAVGCFPRGASR